jgi:hypothetical protein
MQHRLVLTFAGLNQKSHGKGASMTTSRVGPRTRRTAFFNFLFVTLALLVFFTSALVWYKEALCAQATLAWDSVSGWSPMGYRLHYGTVSKNYSFTVDSGTRTSYTVTGLNEGATYYFAATAYSTSGTESVPSNEVAYTIPSSCSYSIAPTSQTFATAAPGTGSVTVNAQSSCTWSASNPASWITITSGVSGKGNGTVGYSLSANTGSSSRTAGLTIAGAVFTVTQAGTATYVITASAGPNGTISPAGQVAVSRGASRSFTVAPASGYQIAGVAVDGISVGAVTSYTFNNVTAGHTINASFVGTSTSYTLTINKTGTGSGTVSTNPAGTIFPAGTKVALTAIPGRGSVFSAWSGGCSGTSPGCTISMSSNASVIATFRQGRGGH